ncbi:helix-turn-helix transcriptional regulator [Streptomyces sp. NBC_00091]|uniref:helix-turn-helix transcriptional regulator n=1 Tax=Streptomyces sp. NBC_00091 TaxID=2975648 RepID=UPI00225A20B7|nr:helix-turn-helix transcriptional regulator [Streptomyces sp. NBC_00091]MCX5376670.1 hypothetical protein [Streptomyces sp. NBC_00091]
MEAGRTQEQQAAAINTVSGRDTMTRREISLYENGENIPTTHTLAHIAVACGLRKPAPHVHGAGIRQAGKNRSRTTWSGGN